MNPNDNYYIGKYDDKKYAFYAETVKDDIYYRIEFKFLEDRLAFSRLYTSRKNPGTARYEIKKNKVTIKGSKVEINLQLKLKNEDDTYVEFSHHKVYSKEDIVDNKFDLFSEISNELKIFYIKGIIEDGQIYRKSPFIIENSKALFDFIYHIDHKDIKVNTEELTEKIELKESAILAENFLKKMGYDVDINALIEDNTIRMYDTKKNEKNGNSYYNKDEKRKIIEICKNETIEFPSVLIHELMHHINLPENKERSQASDYITEGISYAYEFIFLDSLKDTKYNDDHIKLLIRELSNLANSAYISYYPMATVDLYKNNEEFTIKDIEERTKINLYIRDMEDFIKKRRALSDIVWHVIGYYIGFYSLIEYKKDPKFLEKLRKLNDTLNDKTFEECIKTIDINGLEDVYGKVDQAVDEVIKRYTIDNPRDISCKK